MPEIKSKMGQLSDIKQYIKSNSFLAIGGGWSCNKPMAIVREIIRQNITGLKAMSIVGGFEMEWLLAAGCLDHLVFSFLSLESFGLPPNFRRAAEKKKIGTFWQPSAEAIIACKPDLVVTLWFEQQKAVANSLERLGYQILTLKIETIGELLTAIQEIGIFTKCQSQAVQLLNELTGELNDMQLRLGSAKKVKVLWIVQAEPLRVAGRNTFINELIELAGGENAIGDTLQQYPPIGTEEILACGAEVIIQSAMGTGNMAEQQKAAEVFWSRWENLPAVKKNRIHVVEPDTVTRLGPRLYQGVELIARCLHPDIFEQGKNAAQQTR